MNSSSWASLESVITYNRLDMVESATERAVPIFGDFTSIAPSLI